MGIPKVAVLLSTYNGARHLDVLLSSIREQQYRNWHVVARDDGSIDDTIVILGNWTATIPLTFVVGTHVGAKASFLKLLYDCSDYDIVAFADQDDVWYSNKIARATQALLDLPQSQPAMYCSRAHIVDEKLRPLGFTLDWPCPPSFENALVENIAMGCTVALNKSAVSLLQRAPSPGNARMHDWWCYLVIAAFGSVIFDPLPSLLYRQHGRNTVGAQERARDRMASKISRLARSYSVSPLFDQAADLQCGYGDFLKPVLKRKLNEFLSFRAAKFRPDAFLTDSFRRQFPLDDIVLRTLLALPIRRGACDAQTPASDE